ncbi:unannotated protein [freshwater metagenome]|uniref:Unannotated protein n=1 Tax=freshwater metagenome TaxID=449393 RepID=A0A6J7SJ48_9ZZZZ
MAFVAVAVDEVLIDLLLDRTFGNGHLSGREQRGGDLVARRVPLLEKLDAGEALTEIGAQFGDGVELAGELREGVVGRGQLTLAHGGHGDGDREFLARELAGLRGERERAGLPGRSALERVVEAREHALGAELVGHRLRDEVLDRRAGVVAADIEEQDVALGGGALDGLQRAETGTEPIKLGVDVGLGDLGCIDRHLDGVERGEIELRDDIHLSGEQKWCGVLKGGDVNLGAAEKLDLVLAQGGVKIGVECVVDRLVEHSGAANPLIDDAVGHLALAEPGDVDLRCDALVGGVECWLELLERDLDGELHPGGREGLESALHGICTPGSGTRRNW